MGHRRAGRKAAATNIMAADPAHIRDLTGTDLRNAILALAGADLAVSNDSGLLHVAAAMDTPTIGIFGPTSPWHWAPLNPLAGVIETAAELPCRPCHKPDCRLGHHRCMRDIPVERLVRETAASPPRFTPAGLTPTRAAALKDRSSAPVTSTTDGIA